MQISEDGNKSNEVHVEKRGAPVEECDTDTD